MGKDIFEGCKIYGGAKKQGARKLVFFKLGAKKQRCKKAGVQKSCTAVFPKTIGLFNIELKVLGG